MLCLVGLLVFSVALPKFLLIFSVHFLVPRPGILKSRVMMSVAFTLTRHRIVYAATVFEAFKQTPNVVW